jgi:hypothetical protein
LLELFPLELFAKLLEAIVVIAVPELNPDTVFTSVEIYRTTIYSNTLITIIRKIDLIQVDKVDRIIKVREVLNKDVLHQVTIAQGLIITGHQ